MLTSLFWLGFALAASPGPDFFLITSNTLSAGRSKGYLTLAGNRISLCIHITIAVLGLAVILQQSHALYLTVSALGGSYLAFLGWKKLRAPLPEVRRAAGAGPSDTLEAATAFRQGFFNNLFNPKVSLFFLSLFPQFTSPDLLHGSPFTIGVIFFIGNTTWWVPLIFLVGLPALRSTLQRFQRLLDIAFGILFLFLGVRVIVVEGARILG